MHSLCGTQNGSHALTASPPPPPKQQVPSAETPLWMGNRASLATAPASAQRLSRPPSLVPLQLLPSVPAWSSQGRAAECPVARSLDGGWCCAGAPRPHKPGRHTTAVRPAVALWPPSANYADWVGRCKDAPQKVMSPKCKHRGKVRPVVRPQARGLNRPNETPPISTGDGREYRGSALCSV